MNQITEISEFIFTVDARRPSDYSYLKAEPGEVTFNRYEGKSLEEIRKQYGKDTADMVYSVAAMGGGDMTKSKITDGLPPEPRQVKDIMLRRRECRQSDTTVVEVILLHNEYTAAAEDRKVRELHFSRLPASIDGSDWPFPVVNEITKIMREAT